MFRRKTHHIGEVVSNLLREEGLETPLNEKRIADAWESVTGTLVARYSGEKFVKNQTLHVKITSPALRQDLSMMRSQLVKRLNQAVGAVVITDVRLY